MGQRSRWHENSGNCFHTLTQKTFSGKKLVGIFIIFSDSFSFSKIQSDTSANVYDFVNWQELKTNYNLLF